MRDGTGFLRWVESFFDISKEQAQINIKKDFSVKMKISPSDPSRDAMEKAWLDGLSLWKRSMATTSSTAVRMTGQGTAP